MRFKKILGVVLSAAMLISSVNVTLADENTTGVSKIPNTTSVEKAYDGSYDYVMGYASVNGGIKDRAQYVNTDAHKKVATEREFLDAIIGAKEGKVKIIELTKDLDFGYKYLNFTADEKTKYSFVSEYKKPSVATTLTNAGTEGFTNLENKEKGVSQVSIEGVDGLTIFSMKGNSISRAELKLNRSNSNYDLVANDIVIRNIHFKDMWQWDEPGSGKSQKAVGWSNLKLNGATNVWVDHCTFDVAYDGNIDLENGATGISITWCEIGQEADEDVVSGNAVYKSVMDMEKLYNEGKVPNSLYAKYRASATPEEIMAYAAYHDKCHLVGSGDKDCIDYVNSSTGKVKPDSNGNIRMTLAYNHYMNVGQRVPMIRQGTGHLVNCFIDDSSHYEVMNMEKEVDGKTVKPFASAEYKLYRGLNARNGASIAADTCVFKGIDQPIVGAELQGDDLSNMGAPFTKYFANAYNRCLIVNSKTTNNAGDTYTGSSWDNNGDNQFTYKFTWKDKSTINNWAWSNKITNIEGYDKEELEKLKKRGADGKLDANQTFDAFPFEFEYAAEEKLPYEYQSLALEEVEDVVIANAGCSEESGKTAEEWCTAYAPIASAEQTAVDAVVAAIEAIGEVALTDSIKGKIEAAKAKYDALPESSKGFVYNYGDLTEAQITYENGKYAIAKIDAIGEVGYNVESMRAIASARGVVNVLTDKEKALVPNVAVLESAEAKYAAEEAKAIDNVIKLIDAIGTVVYSEESAAKITAARQAYDALYTTTAKQITNVSVLTDAEAQYAALKEEAEKSGENSGDEQKPVDTDKKEEVKPTTKGGDTIIESKKETVVVAKDEKDTAQHSITIDTVQEFNGKKVTPEVDFVITTDDGVYSKSELSNKDYKITYKNNKNVSMTYDSEKKAFVSLGLADAKRPCAIITYKGGLKGIAADTVYFDIYPCDLDDAVITTKAKGDKISLKEGKKIKFFKKVTNVFQDGSKKALNKKKDITAEKTRLVPLLENGQPDLNAAGITENTLATAAMSGKYVMVVEGKGNYYSQMWSDVITLEVQ